MSRDIKKWLESFQSEFTAILRTPLASDLGKLQPACELFPPTQSFTASAKSLEQAKYQLGIYNRQYWFRLFTIMQSAFPLSSRLLGLWNFNQLAQEFLCSHPPSHFDIQKSSSGFYDFLLSRLHGEVIFPGNLTDPLPSEALLKAVEIDEIMERVFMAEPQASLQMTDAASIPLPKLRLIPSKAIAFVEENWELLRLRERLLKDKGEGIVALPPRLSEPQRWAIYRREEILCYFLLEPLQYQFYQMLCHHSLGETLYLLEQACAPHMHTRLQQQVMQWLAKSVELGFWTGFEDTAGISKT